MATGRGDTALITFNRGLISEDAIARIDVERVSMSASEMVNWMPRVFGAMMLRPGTRYLNSVSDSWWLPFIFSRSETALLQFKNLTFTPWVSEGALFRETVAATIENGTFSASTDWTDADDSGGTSTLPADGYLHLVGDGTNYARRRQAVTVVADIEHGIRILIERGPVNVKFGTTAGGDELQRETALGEGWHSFGITPTTTTLHIEFNSRAKSVKLVDSIAIESGGAVSIVSPYAFEDTPKLRFTQSADVVWLACEGYHPYKIERRSQRTWSLVKYLPEDGPFRLLDNRQISITSTATSGDVTLTATKAVWRAEHVGALFRIESTGQLVDEDLVAGGVTGHIRVVGVDNDRRFRFERAGDWAGGTGTVWLQRSIGEPGAWADVQEYGTNGTSTYDDGMDNVIAYYRVRFTDPGSGTAEIELEIESGSEPGVVRITSYTSATSVGAAILEDLNHTQATTVWSEGSWSDLRGYPSAVALYEGRLCWMGKGGFWASVSDAYESFNDLLEGDDGPISRTIGEGTVDNVNWMLALNRLIAGTDMAEKSVRSNAFDEPITGTNISIKDTSTQGSARVAPAKVDAHGLYIDNTDQRVYELTFESERFDYASVDLTGIVPEIGEPGIVHIAVQRKPDTRFHCVRSDGTVAILIHDRVEGIKCWVTYETDGDVKQTVVLPSSTGTTEDRVYYIVERGGQYMLERWALESQCRGGNLNRCADSHVVYTGASATSIPGGTHLNGQSVVVWADGQDVGVKVVSSGAITLDAAATNVCYGLPYTARFQSTDLQFAMGLTSRRQIKSAALILGRTHRQGLRIGEDFDHLENLPLVEEGREVTTDWTAYNRDAFPISGEAKTDKRLCLEAAAPRHCTVRGVLTHGSEG